jgi:thymidylate synthase
MAAPLWNPIKVESPLDYNLSDVDQAWVSLLQEVMAERHLEGSRTGIGCYTSVGKQIRVPLTTFPLVGLKRTHFPSILGELLWMLSGSTNIKYLHELGVTIWDEWADADGDLGPVYGKQWRDFNGVDQIQYVVNELSERPQSRRALLSAWNPAETNDMALPPCHYAAQWLIRTDGMRYHQDLHCVVSMRSCDLFLGLPFNIGQYALLTSIIANALASTSGWEFLNIRRVAGAKPVFVTPKSLVINIADAHVYTNHVDAVKEVLGRAALASRKPEGYPMHITPEPTDDKWGMFLNGRYHHLGAVKADVAV